MGMLFWIILETISWILAGLFLLFGLFSNTIEQSAGIVVVLAACALFIEHKRRNAKHPPTHKT